MGLWYRRNGAAAAGMVNNGLQLCTLRVYALCCIGTGLRT